MIAKQKRHFVRGNIYVTKVSNVHSWEFFARQDKSACILNELAPGHHVREIISSGLGLRLDLKKRRRSRKKKKKNTKTRQHNPKNRLNKLAL